MKQIWAPWRMKYILGSKKEGCIFCNKPKEKKDKKNYLLYRGKTCFIMMNLYPYISGHLMVAPYKHVPDTTQLNSQELAELMKLINKSIKVLREVMAPQGFNIGANVGAVAGAGFDEHIHIHIVPRWKEDTNFMPVISDTRIISEALDDTYKKLKPHF